ncbi:MAG: radical SAM protein [Oscillospiraceae bacterium]|nr:radical SAM protein [Oscillospiraceae bacterium]MBR4691671.1 radical SAM protein [Oscillospiraceae bacterium]
MELLKNTKSVCPVCLRVLDAQLVSTDDAVYMTKECPEHGRYQVPVWEGSADSWRAWDAGNTKKDALPDPKPVKEGCPRDCGLCEAHRRSGCCVLLELTSRCNLRCPVCFASSGESAAAEDPSLEELGRRMEWLMAHGGPFNLQLSGGEPTMRDDLPEIIRMGRERGFSFFQLNTNGVRLARESGYARSLQEAGLNTVFLQFDGLRDEIYETLRGRPLVTVKLQAIRRCAEAGLGVVLVPTVVPGVNDGELGNILRFAEKHMPSVRGVHFQPVSYFGRCELPGEKRRITIPALLRDIERQTDGRMKASDFTGGSAENPYCSIHAGYMLIGGRLKPLKKRAGSACCTTSGDSRRNVARQWSGPRLRVRTASGSSSEIPDFDQFLAEAHDSTLSVSGMLFQDAYNLDLDRLQRCYVCESDPRYGMVPFCAYNLTSDLGRRLYR